MAAVVVTAAVCKNFRLVKCVLIKFLFLFFMKIASIDLKCKITVFSIQILSQTVFFNKIPDD